LVAVQLNCDTHEVKNKSGDRPKTPKEAGRYCDETFPLFKQKKVP
jgi:hypothetical protein